MSRFKHPEYGYAITAILMWSTVATAFKLALKNISPAQLLGIASVVSCITLCSILLVQGRLKQPFLYLSQNPGYYLLLGLLNPCLYYLVLFKAYELLPAQQAQPINYTWAITLSLLAVPFLKHRFSFRDGIAMLLSYLGVVVIATRGDLAAMQFDSGAGVVLALLSTLLWSFYWILNTRRGGEPVASLAACFLAGTPLVLIYCLLSEPLPAWSALSMSAAVYVGIFEMGAAFVFWQLAMRHTGNTARIGNLIFLSPFLSLFFINRVLGEKIEPATYVGLMLIVIALLFQHRKS